MKTNNNPPVPTRPEERKSANVPKVGDDMYIPSEMYVFRGRDDMVGGLTKVTEVKWEEISKAHFITTKIKPYSNMRWEGYLEEKQAELKERFGSNLAYLDPDNDPEFNDDEEGWH